MRDGVETRQPQISNARTKRIDPVRTFRKLKIDPFSLLARLEGTARCEPFPEDRTYIFEHFQNAAKASSTLENGVTFGGALMAYVPLFFSMFSYFRHSM